MEEKQLNPHRHLVLLSKGHYDATNGMFSASKSILKTLYPKEDVTNNKVLQVLVNLAYGAISNTRLELNTHPKSGITITTPDTQMKTFQELFRFMYGARKETIERYNDPEKALEEIMAQSLLVTVARHEYDKEELGETDFKIQASIYHKIFD